MFTSSLPIVAPAVVSEHTGEEPQSTFIRRADEQGTIEQAVPFFAGSLRYQETTVTGGKVRVVGTLRAGLYANRI